jgi:hypothetical protein
VGYNRCLANYAKEENWAGNLPSNLIAKIFKSAFQSLIGIVHFLEKIFELFPKHCQDYGGFYSFGRATSTFYSSGQLGLRHLKRGDYGVRQNQRTQ